MDQIIIEPTAGVILVEVDDAAAGAVLIPIGVPGPAGTTDHGALTGLGDDDHPQYHTDARGDARYSLTGHTHAGVYDPAGTAATLDAAHVAALDPHPQYQTQAEGDARYDAVGAAAAAQATAVQRANHTGTQAAGTITGLAAVATSGAKADVGLGNVDNTSDASKPVSTAQAAAIALMVPLTQKGAANGVAPLGADSKIASTYLPSYVDDVTEAADLAAIQLLTGEAGKIYVAADTGKTYRWSGSAYVEISASPGSTDAVPEGAANLYHTPSRVTGLIAAAVGVSVQAYNAGLAAIAALTTTVFGRDFLTLADAAAARVKLGLANVAATGSYSDLTGTPAAYSLPVATGAVLGGVKSSASITVAGDGTLGLGATVTGPAGSLLTIAAAASQDITIAPSNGSLTISGASINMSSGRQLRWNFDTYLHRTAAAALQMGLDSAAPVSQTFGVANARAGTDTNAVGGNLTIASGRGTGNAASSTLTLATPAPTASGTGGQTSTPRITIKGDLVGVGSGATTPTATLDAAGDTMRLRTARTPASATAAGNAGDQCWDANYFYICVATNTWRRVAHNSW